MISSPGAARTLVLLVVCTASWWFPSPASAQTFSHRGFVAGRGYLFPQTTQNDDRHLVGDFMAREEVFAKPIAWIQFAAGLDARANTHDQVDGTWRLDVRDRSPLRPALSLRRLSATLTRGAFTIDLGKQFIRWGKTDIVTPTDHFAPRDFLSIVDNEFLAVTGVRTVAQWGQYTLDAVWVPFFTPSRTPILDQRWTAVPPTPLPLTFADVSGGPPKGSQSGLRWGRTGTGYEYSLSYYNGFNHLPNIDVQQGLTPFRVDVRRQYPNLHSYGLDLAVPTPWFTLKGEAAYSTSSTATADEFLIYVVQLERQTGEWVIVGGYAGEVVTVRHAQLPFAPDRGLTRSVVARASYTIDTNRSVALETAIRQTGRGGYLKGEYSQARGQHWRATTSATVIQGDLDDFLGQYRRNSYVMLELRYSF